MQVEELIERLAEMPPHYEVRINVTGSPVVAHAVDMQTRQDGPWVEVR